MSNERINTVESPYSKKNAEEEYQNLPDFIKSMIINLYNTSSKKSSSSKNQSNNKGHQYMNHISNFDFDNNLNENSIKIFDIKDNNLFIMKKSFRLRSILQNNNYDYKNNISECSICFRNIINYGLLSNCNDIFCYECIKQWRNEAKVKHKREAFRRCPLCNIESPLLVKSKVYLIGEEKKKKMIEFKQENNIF